MPKTVKALLSACALLASAAHVHAQEQVLNLYSARHYATDEALYSGFTQATGIRIQRVDADDAGILARLRAEGAASPADVILLVDATRLHKGETDGLFQPIQSKLLNHAIPANLRSAPAADGGISWFGLSTRARVIVYNKVKVQKSDVATYESLGDPRNKGRLCIRSGSHPYNLSLFGAVTEHLGEQKAEAWLQGVVANLARPPKGGDTDQIKAVAAGECDIAVTNSYYLARMMRSTKPEDMAAVNKVGVVFPNQESWGTHLNIAGGAVARHSKNPANAIRFLEYLASPEAQNHFANGNNEWPVAQGVELDNPALKAMTAGKPFKSETIPISAVGANAVRVQQMLDRVGFP
ncbi:extracellular solute-binding protein [Verminephrobacter aporrectodeae subsp. tuberculatae]|uniref:extracellular solute-binding protein n=1 Tax=Verminephrobacter aporrectodeae TaxID=1110389 RepID=UPI002238F514|nr:extracellular solute-binding protein [Verminephrobacter aporrectodeae]MCW5221458.1 extracellular solute-binding protein [Verminephrobacter aporrectodeae subsp. tuberculatae]MCW5290750.1 extracellular solute-binding protein [Verminephrobacter aporrectodeae subsp. tuberculatae]